MYEVYLMNLQSGKKFSKFFDSPYKMRLFLNKVGHAKPGKRKLMILSYPYIND